MATVRRVVSDWSPVVMVVMMETGERERRTDGDAEAVKTDEVLAAVAAGDLLAVTALVVAGLGVDVDLGVLVGSTALGESNGGHGGDDERLEEGHFVGLGWVGKGWWEASVVLDWN